jgi:AcrR family transcriptional regulator
MSITTPEGSQRQRRSPQAARENILAAAEAILVGAGPQELKLIEVARVAGVAHATVLHYFGSIHGLQTALMNRMIARLVERVLAIIAQVQEPAQVAGAAIEALFDAFEERGAARLAAWLELTGEARRLTSVREAVRQVIAAHPGLPHMPPPEMLEDFIMLNIILGLGSGLFGETLSELMGQPRGHVRALALTLLRERVAASLAVRP